MTRLTGASARRSWSARQRRDGPASSPTGGAPPPPLASGHAEVVAQGIVGFPDGTFHWQVADGALTAGADPTAVPQAVTFVLADDGRRRRHRRRTRTVSAPARRRCCRRCPRRCSRRHDGSASLLDAVDRQRRRHRRRRRDRRQLHARRRTARCRSWFATCWRRASRLATPRPRRRQPCCSSPAAIAVAASDRRRLDRPRRRANAATLDGELDRSPTPGPTQPTRSSPP